MLQCKDRDSQPAFHSLLLWDISGSSFWQTTFPVTKSYQHTQNSGFCLWLLSLFQLGAAGFAPIAARPAHSASVFILCVFYCAASPPHIPLARARRMGLFWWPSWKLRTIGSVPPPTPPPPTTQRPDLPSLLSNPRLKTDVWLNAPML